MDESPRSSKGSSGAIVALVLVLLALPFAPLGMAFVEHSLYGTRRVEEAFEAVGLHKPLGELYEWTGRLLSP